jgi:hypothetical protein
MAPDMLREHHEIKILTRVHLVGFNGNSCITMHGLKQRKVVTSLWP